MPMSLDSSISTIDLSIEISSEHSQSLLHSFLSQDALTLNATNQIGEHRDTASAFELVAL